MQRLERLCLGLAAALFVAHASLFLEPFEDSYITYRYARNLAEGRGLVYNVGERVEGFTSFGWAVLLGLFAKLGADIPVLAPLASIALGIAAVVLAGVLAQKTIARPYAAVVVAALVGANGTLAYYAASGMETSAFLATFLGAVVLLFSEDRRAHFGAGAMLALVGTLRPESPGYIGALFVALLSTKATRARVLRAAGVFAILFGPWFVWRASYFGFLFPNTYYAKADPSIGRLVGGARYLEVFLTVHLWWLVLPAIAIVIRRRGLVPWVRVGVALIAASFVDVLLVGADAFPFWRFLLVAVPFGMLFVADAVLAWPVRRAVPALVLFGAAQAGSTFAPQQTLLGRDARSPWDVTRLIARTNDDYFRIGDFLARTFPPSTTIAVDAAGIIPFTSALPTVDMLGLNDVHIAHRTLPPEPALIGHEKHDASYVLALAPDIVLPGIPRLVTHVPTPEEIGPWFARSFRSIPGDEELLRKPEFQRRYKVAVADVGGGSYLLFFQRIAVPPPS